MYNSCIFIILSLMMFTMPMKESCMIFSLLKIRLLLESSKLIPLIVYIKMQLTVTVTLVCSNKNVILNQRCLFLIIVLDSIDHMRA